VSRGRKARSDDKLANLTPEQKAMLRSWLVDENLSYDQAKQRLHDDFNVETSKGALSKFYARDCFTLRASEARNFAEHVERELLAKDSTFDRATLALVKQKAFERAYAQNGNIAELATLAGIIGDSAKLDLKKQELQLSREKFLQELRSDLEKGLDALHAEIKGNAEALTLFEKLKAVVMRSVEGRR